MEKRILNVVTNIGHYNTPIAHNRLVTVRVNASLASLRRTLVRADYRQP